MNHRLQAAVNLVVDRLVIGADPDDSAFKLAHILMNRRCSGHSRTRDNVRRSLKRGRVDRAMIWHAAGVLTLDDDTHDLFNLLWMTNTRFCRLFDRQLRAASQQGSADPEDAKDVREEGVGLVAEIVETVAEEVERLSRVARTPETGFAWTSRNPPKPPWERHDERALWVDGNFGEEERRYWEDMYRSYYPVAGAVGTIPAVAQDFSRFFGVGLEETASAVIKILGAVEQKIYGLPTGVRSDSRHCAFQVIKVPMTTVRRRPGAIA